MKQDKCGSVLVVGLIIGAAICGTWFMNNTVYKPTLIEKGFGEYNSTTGYFQLKGLPNG